jgi:type VI secretion system protein VasG
MSEISRAALFGKLNKHCYRAIESATVFCKMRGNPNVELSHWLHQLLQAQDSDLHRALRYFEIDAARLAKDLTDALDKLPRGATSISDFSEDLEESVERGWVYATLLFREPCVRSGYWIFGMLKTRHLRNALSGISRQFEKIKPERLAEEFQAICGGSPETGDPAYDGANFGAIAAPGEASGAMAPAEMGRGDALKRFTVDLTQQARDGRIDPVVGRDEEIRQIIDVLMRRRQNNPILTGEAGVGKTAVVEGFARRVSVGDVPPSMKEIRLLALDVGLLQAGASMKGEFEQRLRQVIDEVQASPKPIVLFIDEVHTLVGAGGASGTGDAANLLKPALARGTLRTIGATTWSEYKKYIEKDPALTRRFQTIKVDEPQESKALLMMRGLVSTMEKHHRVQILDEALAAAVKLSHRYIPDRQLPDKSVSLLDTACARVAISHSSTPAEVEDAQRRIEALETELEIIRREETIGLNVEAREQSVRKSLEEERGKRAQLQSEWEAEKGVVDEILRIRAQLRAATDAAASAAAAGAAAPGAAAPAAAAATKDAATAAKDAAQAAVMSGEDTAAARAELARLQLQLTGLQGSRPLVLPSVDEQAVASVVADWTGIPLGRMMKDEVATVLNLGATLGRRVIGQDHALEMIAMRVRTARAALENPNKPIGVFMLAGPSGVGKTETALTLAEALYGGEQNLITINMSEFQEAHTVSTLKGAPPGYVGYGEGGVLTEAVRRKPYSVVLLDEIEKAHPDVHEIFFQVFDKGVMEDGEGRLIDFKNTLIILTTNVGTDLIMGMCKDPELMPDPDGIAKALRQPMLKTFPAALLGRIVVVPYYPLSDDMMARIIRLQLERIVARIQANHGAALSYSDEVVTMIARRCSEPESGGRMIDAILTNSLLPRMAQEFLSRTLNGGSISSIRIEVDGGDFAYQIH